MLVTRTKYDALERISDVLRSQVAQLERANVILQESVERAETRYDGLLEKYHSLRRDGLTPLPAGDLRTLQPRSPRANVEEAIRLAAGGDKGHASVLRAWVASKRAEGSDEDAIAKELLQPAPADEEGVPA